MKILVPSYVEERDGQLYAGDTRVPITTIIVYRIIHHRTPEEIHQGFPTVPLATIYGVIAYYLDHQQEIDEQIARNDALFEKTAQAQLDDPNSMTNMVQGRIKEAQKHYRGRMKLSRDDERPRILADECIHDAITQGRRFHYLDMDLLTLKEAQQLHIKDPELLKFAQSIHRILLSHDENTLPQHFADFMAQLGPNEMSPGVWIVHDKTPTGIAIQTIAEYWGASRHEEWQNKMEWLAKKKS